MNAITSDAQQANAATDREQVLRELLDEAHARIRSLEALLRRRSEADDQLLGAEASHPADPPRTVHAALIRKAIPDCRSEHISRFGAYPPVAPGLQAGVNTAHPQRGTVR
jgi:hypothetical protein